MPDASISEQRTDALTQTAHKVDGAKISQIKTELAKDPDNELLKNLSDSIEKNEDTRLLRFEGRAGESLTDALERRRKEQEQPELTKDNLKSLANSLGIESTSPKLKKLEDMFSYGEAVKKALHDRTTVESAAGGVYPTLRDSIIDAVVKDGGIYDLFPELSESGKAASDLIITEYIANDPRFHAEVTAELQRIKALSDKLPEDSLDTSKTTLETQRDNTTKIQERLEVNAISKLSEQGLADDEANEIVSQLKEGLSQDEAIKMLGDQLAEKNNLRGQMNFFEQYTLLYQIPKGLEGQIHELNNQLNSAQNEKDKQRLRGQIADLALKKGEAQGRLDAAIGAIKSTGGYTTDEEFGAAFGKYQNINSLLSESSGFRTILNGITERNNRVQEIQKQIGDIDASGTKSSEANDRKDLERQFNDVLARSLENYIEKKITAAQEDQGIRLNAARLEAEEAGRTNEADMIKSLKDRLNELDKFDPAKHKRTFDEVKIRSTADKFILASANGEDGTRILVSEFTGFNLDEEVEKDSIANSIETGKNYADLNEAQKEQADTLYTKRKEDFENVLAKQGEEVKKRLMMDIMASRKRFGGIDFSRDEWAILNKDLGSFVDQEIAKSGKAQNILKAMREKGSIPDFKMKWIIYLLAILGLGPAASIAISMYDAIT